MGVFPKFPLLFFFQANSVFPVSARVQGGLQFLLVYVVAAFYYLFPHCILIFFLLHSGLVEWLNCAVFGISYFLHSHGFIPCLVDLPNVFLLLTLHEFYTVLNFRLVLVHLNQRLSSALGRTIGSFRNVLAARRDR